MSMDFSIYHDDNLSLHEKRVKELEKDRDRYKKEADYYRKELGKSHELLGRVLHQTSERWDSVRISGYFPTDNLHNKRTLDNPEGK